MHSSIRRAVGVFVFVFSILASLSSLSAQSTSGLVTGVVKDSTGAVIPGVAVSLDNPVSGYSRQTTSDSSGQFRFYNLPFNPYRVAVKGKGFGSSTQTVEVESGLPISLTFALKAAGESTTVNVEAPPDLLETDPHFHTDIDRSTINRLPIEQPTSELSSIVTQLSPGVAADSNGLLHGLGDHNEVSFNIDGQPITDQQSKVFSNQVPAAAIQSLEVIEGAPTAEYGDKTSLVIVGTTRSGQGVTKPTGAVTFSYGSFGTSNTAVDLSYGGKNWGNFIAANFLQSGRFLDAPEFFVYHDKGNEENIFDRVDRQLGEKASVHTNLQYTRSWFQTPNTYDTQYNYISSGQTTGITDQRSKIETFDIAPTYTRLIDDKTIFNFGPYVRRDGYNYYPSKNLLNDFGPIQGQAVAQQRSLLNAGVHSDISRVQGHNSFKFGGMYSQTFLRENLQFGLVDPGLNDPTSATFDPILAPYDLTRGGKLYHYHGQTDVKQLALYGQDQVTAGNWLISLGVRGDFYNGLAIQKVAEPRLGVSYSIKKTGTVLRTSYARTQETPFNENLVLSSTGCLNPVLNSVFTQSFGFCNPASFNPGFRNEFHVGLQQAVGHHFVLSGDYITKYTHNAYDFSVFSATPITFPIEWHNSKIPGFSLAGTLTEVKGFTARVTMSSVAARFFNPQIGGVGSSVQTQGNFPFRIDHDERFNQTTHLEYKMPFRKSLYYSFNWKLDSGLTAASTPCYNVVDPNTTCANFSFDANGNPLVTANGKPLIDLSGLTADQQFEEGLACDGVRATATKGFQNCDAAGLTSSLARIPGINQSDDDRNPARIAQRNLFDMELGDDNLFHLGRSDRYKVSARLTATNVANKTALFNFLSTFSGTHYVTPRTVTAQIAFHF